MSVLVLASAAADDPHSAEPMLAATALEPSSQVRTVAASEPIAPASEPKISEAERIARLQRAIEVDDKHLAELQSELASPHSEYQKADTEFRQLDGELADKRNELARLSPKRVAEADQLRAQLAEFEHKWTLAKNRFELAIQERKALQESIGTLEQKMAKDRAALDKLTQPAAHVAADQAATELPFATAPHPSEGTAQPRRDEPTSSPAAPAPLVGAIGSLLPMGIPMLPKVPAETPPAVKKPPSKELTVATEEAKRKEVVARQAQEAAESITDRTEILKRNIELERKLLETAHKKVDNADETLDSLHKEFNERLLAGTDPNALADLRRQIAEADARLRDARIESRQRSKQLDELHSELAGLQAEQISALAEADSRAREARSAQQRVADLRNPFTLRNLLEWLMYHGPKIITILLAMGCFVWLYRGLEARLVDLLTHRGGRGTADERENRAKTLVGVFHNAAGVVIIAGGILMLLDEVGIPIAPLMGGAAVIGLAVAFGAQSLIKDYFSGFMILLEQQYLVNDVVKIGEVSGQVERITLRMTMLRDLEGRVHFLPHGEISSVTNMSHGWSRAVFDIGIGYKEDVDRVMNVLVELGRQLREDPQFYNMILEDPEMLGVDAFGDSAVAIKFCIKTRPLKQWLVKRELMRRIKIRFDHLGIEIPFPTRTVVHHYETGAAADNLPPEAGWTDKRAA